MALVNAHTQSDPAAVIKWLEDAASAPNDPHWTRFDTLFAAQLKHAPFDADNRADAALLRRTQAGAALEGAARQAGWIMGFQFLAQLLAAQSTTKGGA